MTDPAVALQCAESAYYGVVKAFCAGNKLGFEVEDFLEELRTVLGVSEDRHLEFLDLVQRDAEAAQLNSYAPSTAQPTAPLNPALSMPSTMMPAMSLQHSGMLPLHDPSMYALAGHPGMAHGDVGGAGGAAKKSKKASNTGAAREGVAKRPPPLATSSYGNASKKSKTTTPASTPISKKKGGALKDGGLLHQNGGGAVVVDGGTAAAEAQLIQLNTREREIFTELINLGVADDDPDLNDVHRALLKWYRLDIRQQEVQRELATL